MQIPQPKMRDLNVTKHINLKKMLSLKVQYTFFYRFKFMNRHAFLYRIVCSFVSILCDQGHKSPNHVSYALYI